MWYAGISWILMINLQRPLALIRLRHRLTPAHSVIRRTHATQDDIILLFRSLHYVVCPYASRINLTMQKNEQSDDISPETAPSVTGLFSFVTHTHTHSHSGWHISTIIDNSSHAHNNNNLPDPADKSFFILFNWNSLLNCWLYLKQSEETEDFHSSLFSII